MAISDILAISALGVAFVLVRDSLRVSLRENVRGWFVWFVVASLIWLAVIAFQNPVGICADC